MAFSILSIVPAISVGVGFGKIRTWLSWQEAETTSMPRRRGTSSRQQCWKEEDKKKRCTISRDGSGSNRVLAMGGRTVVDFILQFGLKFDGIHSMCSWESTTVVHGVAGQPVSRSIYREEDN